MLNKENKSVSTKPWQTKEWKKLRDNLLKKKCKQCGNTNDLVLQHLWHPPSYLTTWKYVVNLMFRKWIRAKRIDLLEGVKTRNEKREKRKILLKQFLEEKKAEVDAKVTEERQKDYKRYMSGVDTVTFCKKCAFLMDRKNKKLCRICKKNYHDIYYDTCHTCKGQADEESRQEGEIFEQLRTECLHEPRCPDVYYSCVNGSGGGNTYKCNFESICKKYPGILKIMDDQDLKRIEIDTEISGQLSSDCSHNPKCKRISYSYFNSDCDGITYKCNFEKICEKYPDIIKIERILKD